MAIFKRMTALFLCLVLAFGLCACKEEEKSTSKKKTNQSSDDTDDTGDTDSGDNGGNGGSGIKSGTEIFERDESVTLPPLTVPEETAQEVADEFIAALQAGDWDSANSRMAAYTFSSAGIGGLMPGGIMEKIIGSMTVKSQTVTDNGDGTYTVKLNIEAIDFRALLESLPEDIDSKDEARSEMLRLADSAARKSFTGELTILRYSEVGQYYIEPQISFVNAITGGLYDVYEEYIQEVAEQ